MAETVGDDVQHMYSSAETSSIENIGLFLRERKLLFTSDWHFEDTGVADATAQLNKDLDEHNMRAVFSWQQEHAVFVITCLPGQTDHVSTTFLRILRDIIAKECVVDTDDAGDRLSNSSDWEDVQPIVGDKITPLSERSQAEDGEQTGVTSSALQSNQSSDSQLLPQGTVQTSHVFHSEESGAFQVVLKNIVDIGKRYFQTTLLDRMATPTYENDYNTLHLAFIARCAAFDKKKNTYAYVKEPKYRSATVESEVSQSYRDWTTFTYPEYGTSGKSQRLAPISQQQGQGHQLLQQNQYQSIGPTILTAGTNVSNVMTHDLHERSSYPSLLDDDASVLNIPSLLEAGNSGVLISFSGEPTIAPELRPANRIEELSDVSAAVAHSTAGENASKPSRDNRVKRKNGPLPGPAKRLPLPSPIRQKPPQVVQPSSQINQTIFQVVTECNQMLEQFRDFQGKLEVRACFGRILLKNLSPKLIAGKESDKSQRQDLLCNILNSPPANTSFTNVLTSVGQDIHFLLDLKEDTGDRMWNVKPYKWGVYYDFHYISRLTGHSFTIEFDGESMQHKVYANGDLGRIFVHGLKRHWDLKVAIKGYIDAVHEYDELVDAIKRTLFIPPSVNTPSLYFELSLATNQIYELKAVRVRRVTNFRNNNSSPNLNISEIQDLDIYSKDEAEGSIKLYKASRDPETRSPLLRLPMWYEASTSCPEIDEKLEELARRKEMKSAPEELAKLKGTETLLLPALQMLKYIDGVGFWNCNDIVIDRPIPPPAPPPDDDCVW